MVILTRSYDNRAGVRYVTNGMKVYHMPTGEAVFPSGKVSLPTVFGSFPIFRQIVLREQIQIVHGHQASSVIGHECMGHAKTMGIPTCFTDHSLLGFADAASIHLNKVLSWSLCDIDHSICVSHTSKENTVLRAGVDPARVSVIPNAVDATALTPNPSQRRTDGITVVIMSRLVYRKGVDLLVELLPRVLSRHPEVDVIIGGDGPMRIELEQMRERHQLLDRVQMLGMVPANDVRDVLVKGHIFLNCSLTEAFCIAIIEAACCGLLVVSTNVGGVPEVLPGDLMRLAEPVVEDLSLVMEEAIADAHKIEPQEMHDRVKEMYSWHDVARRTEEGVYNKILREERPSFLRRLENQNRCGVFAGKLFCTVIALDMLIYYFLMWLWPAETIDIVPDFDLKQYHAASGIWDDNTGTSKAWKRGSNSASLPQGGLPARQRGARLK